MTRKLIALLMALLLALTPCLALAETETPEEEEERTIENVNKFVTELKYSIFTMETPTDHEECLYTMSHDNGLDMQVIMWTDKVHTYSVTNLMAMGNVEAFQQLYLIILSMYDWEYCFYLEEAVEGTADTEGTEEVAYQYNSEALDPSIDPENSFDDMDAYITALRQHLQEAFGLTIEE